MLQFIGHAIANREYWSEFEQNLWFSVAHLAFWGTFRLGELLGKEKNAFHSSTSLLASDVTKVFLSGYTTQRLSRKKLGM